MPHQIADLVAQLTKLDPLTLAVLFLGLTALGLIWLAGKAVDGRAKKERAARK